MKRRISYWIIITVALLNLLLTACGGSSTEAVTEAVKKAETETEAAAEAVKKTATEAAAAEADTLSSISVWLVNHTGEDLSAVYVSPANAEEWGENRISGIMSDGDKCQVILSDLTEEIISEGFNALGLNADGDPYLDLAETEWTFQLADGDYIVLLPGDPEIDITDSYNKADYEEVLKAHAEAGGVLDQTIRFPGDFSNVVIDYPSSLAAYNDMAENTLIFANADPQTEEDAYANMVFTFVPVGQEDDQYLSQGAGTAKLYMKHLLDGFLKAVYGNNLIKSISSDFVDGGNYYGINSYVWLESAVFGADIQQPVRGCMETRYFGPTGYALVGFTTAMDEKFQDYCETFTKMLDSCNYTADWSTSPKAIPKQPELKAGTSAVPAKSDKKSGSKSGSKRMSQQSDSGDTGDYGTPYYWYDEDGDVWYWNGYENEFIGFGDHYYIDDDGEYYESNDWTPYDWYEDDWYYYDDYDPWSDPGDLYDYEEYSDSGDYGTDYSWTDEDGDIWYWDGFEDQYVGSGDDYYIDDDGQYYENNDYDPDLDYGDYYYDDSYDDSGYDDYGYDDYDDYGYDDYGYDDYGYDDYYEDW